MRPGIGLRGVWAEDLERLVRCWVEGERGAVWAMEVGVRRALRHFSASDSHAGDAGWSPNRKSSGKSPQPSRKEGLEGTEEATLRGLDDMAS